MGINSWIDQIFIPKTESKEFTFERYLKELKDGEYRDKFVFGVLENESKLHSVNMFKAPNSLYVGSMGSGKSKGAVFSIMTWMLANSDQTILFIVDPMKGAGDYSALFDKVGKTKKPYNQVYDILSSEQGIIKLIDMIYDEAMARRNAFAEVNAESLPDYESKTGKKIARILTVMEEFHAIPFAIMNFYPDFKTDLSTANKFHTLMRIGRSYGIWFVACTQKSTKSDIPTEMTPNFVNKNIFRVSSAESNYLLGDPRASQIKPTQQGRCFTEYGVTQFPLFETKESNTEERLLKKFMKPLNAECVYLNEKIIVEVLSGRDSKDQLKHKKLTELVESIEAYNSDLVVTLFHEKQGQKVETIDSKLDNFQLSHVIHYNNDVKAAVMTRCKKDHNKITTKHLARLKNGMDRYECNYGIVYTSMNNLPAGLYKFAGALGIELVDHEDFVRAAYKVEVTNAKIDPDKLADDTKEAKGSNASFDDSEYEMGSFDLDEDKSTISSGVDLSKIEEDRAEDKDQENKKKASFLSNLIDEDFKEDFGEEDFKEDFSDKKEDSEILKLRERIDFELSRSPEEIKEEIVEEINQESLKAHEAFKLEQKKIEDQKPRMGPIVPKIDNSNLFNSSTKTPNKSLKREKVTKYCSIKKEETPSLLIHAMRTEEGEIFRLFFMILDNNVSKHRYFLDRKIKGKFSFKEKQLLGVTTEEEWNGQKESLDFEQFDLEVLAYLSNFENCTFPVHSVCWQIDEEFFKRYLKQCKYMISNPTVIEKHTSAFFNSNESRSELIRKMDIKKSKVGFFNPIDIDLEIWKNTN